MRSPIIHTSLTSINTGTLEYDSRTSAKVGASTTIDVFLAARSKASQLCTSYVMYGARCFRPCCIGQQRTIRALSHKIAGDLAIIVTKSPNRYRERGGEDDADGVGMTGS